MKKVSKILCLTLGSVMAFGTVGLACACGDDKGGSGDGVTISMWVPEADRAFLNQVIDAYKKTEKGKNVEILVGIQGENDSATKVLNDVENAPNLFSFASDQLNRLVVGDALAQIGGERLTRITEANTANSLDACTVTVNGQNQTYAFPYTDNTFFLYYDKSKFTETDVQTLDGILAKCSKDEQFGYPIDDSWYSAAFFFGKGLGYEVTYNDKLAEVTVTTDFASETGVKVAEAMKGYVANPGFKADSNDSKLVAGITGGNIIAGVSGIWNKNAIEEALGENFGAVKLPTYTLEGQQVQLTAFAGYKCLGVSKHGGNSDPAVRAVSLDFAEFYTNKENQIKHFEARGFLPTNKEAQNDDKVKNDVCAKAISDQLQYSKTQKGVPSAFWAPMISFGQGMIAQGDKFNCKTELEDAVKNFVK